MARRYRPSLGATGGRLTGVLAAALLLTACVTAGPTGEALRTKIWQETVVDIIGFPPAEVRNYPALQEKGRAKSPAVVYLHGCGGRGNTAHSHIRFFKLNGFAVFAPDHFTRSGVSVQCNSDTARAWATSETYAQRTEEAAIARDGLRQFDWIDQDRVFLVGHSQGAATAAGYPNAGDFAGIVAIATSCWNGVESHTPLLTIVALHDEWTKHSNVSCKQHMQSNATHLVVEGGDHNFILDANWLAPPERKARDAILDFVKR